MTHTVGPLGAPIKDGPGGSSNKKIEFDPLKMTSFKFRVVLCRIRLCPTSILKKYSLGFEIPLKKFS